VSAGPPGRPVRSGPAGTVTLGVTRQLAEGATVLMLTPGVLLAAVAAGLLHVTARATGGGWLALGSAGVLALPVVAGLLRPPLDQLRVERTGPGRAAVGDRVPVELVVTNAGPRATPPVVLRDALPGYRPVVVAVPALAPGASARVRGTRLASQRVCADGGTCCLRASSPVGLLAAHRHVRPQGRVVVHPFRLSAPRVSGPGTRGEQTVPLLGSAPEVLGLREWRRGEHAALSARATARHGRPLVLEREREVAGDLVVLVAPGSGVPWEISLARAAALAVEAVQRSTRVVLVGVPRPAGPGVVAVLDALSAADDATPFSSGTLGAALSAARGGGVLVLVAPPDALELRGQVRRAADAARVPLVVPDG